MTANKPSVTTVLGKFSDFSSIPPAVLRKAADRGTAVHDAIQVHLEGGFACPPPEAQGYFDSACSWIDKMVESVIVMETRFHDDQYHGKCDLVARLKDGTTGLLDWKTPAQPAVTWNLQIAAYRHLAAKNGIEGITRGMCVRVRKDGGPAIVDEYTNYTADLNMWWACLAVYQTFYQGEK